MNSSRRSYVVLLILAVGAVALYFGLWQTTKFDWKETYDEDSDQPYGTQVVYELLRSYWPGYSFRKMEKSLLGELDTVAQPSNLVLIAQAFDYDTEEMAEVFRYAERGNTVFMSTKSVPSYLMQALRQDSCFAEKDYQTYLYDSTATLNFYNSALHADVDWEVTFYDRGMPSYFGSWSHMPWEWFCESNAGYVPLGYSDQYVNFAFLPYGKGGFYLHTTPMAFANLHLLKSEKLAYAAKVFSHLPKGGIIWDGGHRIDEAVSRLRNGERNLSADRQIGGSPLKYILAQPALAWAWYLLLAGAVLYLIFRAKRRQRIVPVLEANTNTSLQFVGTIGKLFHQKGNARQVAIQKMRFLQAFVRERYNLPLRDWDDDYLEQLHQKSQVDHQLLSRIALMYRNVLSSRTRSNEALMQFHQMIEAFFRSRK
jgi:hypothetical protein